LFPGVYDDDDADGEPDAGELYLTNTYDGLNRRSVATVGGNDYEYYYNTSWQMLARYRNRDQQQDQRKCSAVHRAS
jgi:hypothetical protein